MSFLAAAGIMGGASLLGGLVGGHDARKAQGRQTRNVEQAIAENSKIADDYRTAADVSLGQQQQAVDLLSFLPKEVAAAFDAGLATELRRTVEERQREKAMQQQRLEAAGLGGTTVGAQVRRAIDRQAGRSFADISARFAQGRGSAVGAATGMYAGAITQQAGMTEAAAAREAAIRQFGPQLRGNTQFTVPNTGAQIGALGAGLGSLFMQQSMLSALSPREAALGDLTSGGGYGTPFPDQSRA